MSYKWKSPQEWLLDRIRELASEGATQDLADEFASLVEHCDADTIQDNFQDLMVDEGYFHNSKEVASLTREECVALLEQVSIQCYDDEDVAVLREAVRVNLEDGTIDRQDIPHQEESP